MRLRGVAVHNLKHVDLDLPHQQWIAFCGVSGSGKSSLAIDTLYAEGQRRYIESFSTYTRQYVEQLEKPAAERIEGIPPSIVISRKHASRSSRATVGSATQINEHLQLLFARIGQVICHGCGQAVVRDSSESAAQRISTLPKESRLLIGFTSQQGPERDTATWLADLKMLGYHRCLWQQRTRRLDDLDASALADAATLEVVLDRLTVSDQGIGRLRDSLETALEAGRGTSLVWSESAWTDGDPPGHAVPLDGRPWYRRPFSQHFRCDACNLDYPAPEPQLLSFNSPLGACPRCEGFGNIVDIDMQRVVPAPDKSIREGAIAPWNTPAYAHELEELLALAPDYGLPVDIPFQALSADQLRIVREGVPERNFGGLAGFFQWLEKRKYKTHLRVFLSRWRSYYLCDQCHGARLQPAARAVRIGNAPDDKNICELWEMKISAALAWLRGLPLVAWQQQVGRRLLDQVTARLEYLDQVGVGHLTLGRALRTLSSGETQRVALTSALGSNLVGMLYVLDEPSVGLHPADVPQLVDAIGALRDRGNTVAVVEHEPEVIRAADRIVELGPGAGGQGGEIVFTGTLEEMLACPDSRTGDWLAGRHGWGEPSARRAAEHGAIRLSGARGNNLRNVTVEFPLGVLCLVSGVSGAGKSTLVEQTLYPAVARRLRKNVAPSAPYDEVLGVGGIEEVVLVDPSPIGRTPRSNPVTYVKAFDPIRQLFAATPDAQARGFKAGHFSFNVAGGRCDACKGDGFKRIDMRFLADVYMRCDACQGTRYRPEVLEVKYRNCSIADILSLSVRESLAIFRGHRKILSRLQCLLDVGLDYLQLGQPANTLSGGEAQRLKLATYLTSARRGRTLFVLDEPTTGLHFSDVLKLLDCFDALISMGHSLVVVDHNRLLIASADYLIDLGPGAAAAGGTVVGTGTPEELAKNPNSLTGRFLAASWSRPNG